MFGSLGVPELVIIFFIVGLPPEVLLESDL